MQATVIDQKYLVGSIEEVVLSTAQEPFSDVVCEFLSDLSIDLLKDDVALTFPDIISFAYWCRRANIQKLKTDNKVNYTRKGLGIVFHIAPSNVPINFAFSFAFSLLAGNSNIVRVSSKNFPQTEIVCTIINNIFTKGKYADIKRRTCILQYEHNDEKTARLSSLSNARIIWGGDHTIQKIRNHPIDVRGIDIAFADRYSICAIHSDSILTLDQNQLEQLAVKFYNDTYLMDQNACSSPHLVIWEGSSGSVEKAQNLFWNSLSNVVENRYELQPIQSVDKYSHACQNAIELTGINQFKNYKNYLYVVTVTNVEMINDTLRGQCGYFYEWNVNDIGEISRIINNKYQTLTYFGFEKDTIFKFVNENQFSGLDRIVPIGSALDISIVWDGYNLINTLSRIIDIK